MHGLREDKGIWRKGLPPSIVSSGLTVLSTSLISSS